MSDCRRNALRNCTVAVAPTRCSNPGLWLHKYLSAQPVKGESIARDEGSPYHKHAATVASIAEAAAYAAFYDRWKRSLQETGAALRVARMQGRTVIGLGGESVIETAITLHRTYGVPFIPGSALKGLAASYARNKLDDHWKKGSKAYNIVFGTTDDAGYVTFFDALYVPGSAAGGPLHEDVMTVHHEEYYQGKGVPPADWDSPNPIAFLSATGEYLLALSGPPLWTAVARDILLKALKEDGVGAKTSSGYGRMVPAADTPSAPVPEEKQLGATPAAVDPVVREINALRGGEIAPRMAGYGERWQKLPADDPQKRARGEAIVAKICQARLEGKFGNTEWFKQLLAFLGEAAGQ